MNVSKNKKRTPLGEVIFKLPDWQKNKIKDRLTELGLSEGKWRGIHERVEAHLLPTFVRDVIIEELPQTKDLFEHPKISKPWLNYTVPKNLR